MKIMIVNGDLFTFIIVVKSAHGQQHLWSVQYNQDHKQYSSHSTVSAWRQ